MKLDPILAHHRVDALQGLHQRLRCHRGGTFGGFGLCRPRRRQLLEYHFHALTRRQLGQGGR